MLETVTAVMLLISIVTSVMTGNTADAGAAFVNGAKEAVTLVISISGMMALWSGLLAVASRCKITELLKRLFKPVMKRFFGRAAEDGEATDSISQNISANLLGLGNAATPAGIKASDRLFELGQYRALGFFIILNTASVQLLPVTAAAIRAANGAENPFSVTVPVLTVSAVSLMSGLLIFSIITRFTGKRKC